MQAYKFNGRTDCFQRTFRSEGTVSRVPTSVLLLPYPASARFPSQSTKPPNTSTLRPSAVMSIWLLPIASGAWATLVSYNCISRALVLPQARQSTRVPCTTELALQRRYSPKQPWPRRSWLHGSLLYVASRPSRLVDREADRPSLTLEMREICFEVRRNGVGWVGRGGVG